MLSKDLSKKKRVAKFRQTLREAKAVYAALKAKRSWGTSETASIHHAISKNSQLWNATGTTWEPYRRLD